MKIEISCPELKRTMSGLKQLGIDGPKAVARGMRGWAEVTATEAKRVTPRANGGGALRNSIFVKREQTGAASAIIIGAGGNAAPYATAVHEHLSRHSPPSWKNKPVLNWNVNGTGPKFLENPIRERMPKLDADVGAEIDKELRKVAR